MRHVSYQAAAVAPLPLAPEYAFAGNEADVLALDFGLRRAIVRDTATAANLFDGDPAALLTVARASGAGRFNAAGRFVMDGNDTLRRDHDPASLDSSASLYTIGRGYAAFTTTGAVTYIAGQAVQITDKGNSANYVIGEVVSYAAGALLVLVSSRGGAGQHGAWDIIVCRGVLIEEQRANWLSRSQEFDSPPWLALNSSIVPNAATAPDGTLTADKLIESATSTTHSVAYYSFFLELSTTYTFSVFAKAGERQFLFLRPHNNTSVIAAGGGAYFDLSLGIITKVANGITAAMEPCGGGYYRCSVTGTTDASGSLPVGGGPAAFVSTTGTALQTGQPYMGDGVSGIYLWGAQMEVGAFPTSYVPTGATTATRASDRVSLPTSKFPFSAAAGTFVARYQYNRIIKGRVLAGLNFTGLLTYNGTLVSNYNGSVNLGRTPTVADDDFIDAALTYNAAGRSLCVPGSVPVSDGNGIGTVAPTLWFGSRSGSAEWINRRIRRVRYFPHDVSATQLQELSS